MPRYRTVNLKEEVYHRLKKMLEIDEKFSEGLARILDEYEEMAKKEEKK